jgi:murein DD-endopeptidase MepM/ murein hydrolase activator NlpD
MNQRNPKRLEVQIHPSDIQKGVKYLFFTSRQLVVLGLALVGYLLVLSAGAFFAPDVIGSFLKRQEYAGLEATRDKLGQRLVALDERFRLLNARSEQLHQRMNKIYLAYGLNHDLSIGQGGYPVEPADRSQLLSGITYVGEAQSAADEERRLIEQVQVLEAFLSEIQGFEEAHSGQVKAIPSTSPLRGDDFVLTSPFGSRRSPFTKKLDFHGGIDLAAREGTPIYAPADGKVSFAGRYPLRQSVAWWRYGNMVSLRHGDRFITLFGHMQEVKVRTSQDVKQGDLLGTVGNTGWSTNPHLHYEVRRLDDEGNFGPVDPRIYMLDHRWRDEEQLLVRARNAPNAQEFQPLPPLIRR